MFQAREPWGNSFSAMPNWWSTEISTGRTAVSVFSRRACPSGAPCPGARGRSAARVGNFGAPRLRIEWKNSVGSKAVQNLVTFNCALLLSICCIQHTLFFFFLIKLPRIITNKLYFKTMGIWDSVRHGQGRDCQLKLLWIYESRVPIMFQVGSSLRMSSGRALCRGPMDGKHTSGDPAADKQQQSHIYRYMSRNNWRSLSWVGRHIEAFENLDEFSKR